MAQGVRMSPPELRDRVHQLCRANPTIRTVLVETNNGGDVWESILNPLPGGARLVPFRSSVSKQERFAKVHDMYSRGWVSHAKPLVDLEGQMCSFPRGARDDIADATCVALDWFLKDRPRPS
jgi:phage terminase large subunit-like protein